MDVILSLLAIIILSPVLLIIAVLVRSNLGSPILFKQKRPGQREKIFTIYKFRTMTDERDQNGELLPDEIRLTKLGKFLRSTSLDELPELFNILKGDMSIIGPRPLAVQYLPYYNNFEKLRHIERPGLSGLAQINGRNLLNWEQKLAYDIEYVSNITLINDCKILLKTFFIVFNREGVRIRGASQNIDFDIYRQNQVNNKYN